MYVKLLEVPVIRCALLECFSYSGIIALLLFEERSRRCKLEFFIKSYETLLSPLFEEQNNLNTHNALVTLHTIQRLL